MPVSPITPSSAPPVIIHERVDWAALASPLTYASSSCALRPSEPAPPVTLRMTEGLVRCHTSVITLQMLCGSARLDTTMKRAGASLSRSITKSMVPYVASTSWPFSSCRFRSSFSKSSSSSLPVSVEACSSLVSGLRQRPNFARGFPPASSSSSDMAACSALRWMKWVLGAAKRPVPLQRTFRAKVQVLPQCVLTQRTHGLHFSRLAVKNAP